MTPELTQEHFELLEEWRLLVTYLATVKPNIDREKELRAQIVAGFFPKPKEGVLMSVDFQREDYQEARPDWEMVDTLCDGESAVKRAGELLLPNPVISTGETKGEITNIYARYLERALYVNIVGRTRASLIGAVFRKPPSYSAPANLDYMQTDCDGNGLSIYQQSQKTLEDTLTAGRCGLLVDFPEHLYNVRR
mgnify:CR=1 FL=1